MNKWITDIINSKKKLPMPILSFPAISLMGISVNELIKYSDTQAFGADCYAPNAATSAGAAVLFLS